MSENIQTVCVAGHFPWIPLPEPPRFAPAPKIEISTSKKRNGALGGGGYRRRPPLELGDKVGDLEVISLLPMPRFGQKKPWVRVRCVCGHERDSDVYNLRMRATCTHVAKS